jgi:hypothetical protein
MIYAGIEPIHSGTTSEIPKWVVPAVIGIVIVFITYTLLADANSRLHLFRIEDAPDPDNDPDKDCWEKLTCPKCQGSGIDPTPDNPTISCYGCSGMGYTYHKTC